MSTDVEQILKEVGPCLSSALAAELRKRFQLSEATARKRVSRAQYPVQHLDLPFRRGAIFTYLPHQFQTQAFFRALSDALEANSGAYARILQAIAARGGIMPLTHLTSGASLADVEGQLGADTAVDRLVNASVLTRIDVPGNGACIAFSATADLDEPLHRMKARLIAEEVLLEAFKQWGRNLAFGSYDLFNLRGAAKRPVVGRFEWDMTAPSYLSGLSTWDASGNKPKPGFLVADVLLHEVLDERAVRPFIYKCATLRRVNPGRCLQFFLAEGFTPEALNLLRKNGVVPGRVDELFGREVARALKELISMLTQTAAAAVDPTKFDLLFSSLGRFGAAAGALRGALFEFLAAALLNEEGWHETVINKVYREAGKDLAEVDVRARKADEVLFVECKGIVPGTLLDDAEVAKWLNTRVPNVATRARQNEEFDNCKLKFELWTTGELSATAKALIVERQATVRSTKYTLEVRQGPALKTIALRHKRRQPALLNALEQHFMTSPLSETSALASEARKSKADAEIWPDLTAQSIEF